MLFISLTRKDAIPKVKDAKKASFIALVLDSSLTIIRIMFYIKKYLLF